MRALLTSPNSMSLNETEQALYQTCLTFIADLSLNLMAVKVENHPTDFLHWCKELHDICVNRINMDLLEENQLKPLKKLTEALVQGMSISQLKMAKVLPWPVFSQFIEDNATCHGLEERLALLNYLKELKQTSLHEMIEEDRLIYAGKHTAQHDPSIYKFDAEWFGSTKNAKAFHQVFKEQPQAFQEALSLIPLEGDVTLNEYQSFIKQYVAIFSRYLKDDKAPLTVATRLLAMRRPDQFVALTSSKFDALSKGLGIIKLNNQSFDDYWHEVIATIRNAHWWKSTAPEQEREVVLWENRAVLLDLFFFSDGSAAENSNYIKLRDKPKREAKSASRSVKRSKASAEELVDRALEQEDIPEYVLKMRSTIIKSVQDGKSVDQAITLMRQIFG